MQLAQLARRAGCISCCHRQTFSSFIPKTIQKNRNFLNLIVTEALPCGL
jgi:hypothetical protein